MGDRVRLIEYYLLGFLLANHEANQKEIEVMPRASGNQATAQDLIQDKVSSYLSSIVDEDQSNDRIASEALPRVQELNPCAQKLLSCDEETAPIWCIRCLYAHQQLFNDTIPDLMQAIFAQIDIVTDGLLQEEDFPSLLCCQVYVEFSHLKRCYCGYFEAKKLLRKAESVIGLKLELKGRLGKRTRFQEKKLAQLTASIKCETLKGTGIQSKNYLKAYNRAIKQGKRRNNLIRAMFVGPRNVEESPQVTKELDDNPNFKKQIIETPILSKENAQAATDESSLNNVCLVSSDTTQSDNLIVSISSQVTKISLESEFNSSTMQNDLQDYFVSITKDNKDAKEDRKYAKIWDFGGHSVYHVTHRPFISANNIYILVFNITQNINGKRNIYSSGIIFNCKPEDNNLATLSQRRECCHRLHLIIKEFVLSLSFIRNPIPIRWYIMATILNTSFHRYENQESSSVINQIRAARVRDIMTMQDVTLLAQDYRLYESEEELKAMLMYLHDLGEIIFYQKAGDNGIIITNVDRLLDIFRAIIQLDECLSGSLELKSEYKKASQTGRLSRVYIEYSLKKFKLDENSKNCILNLMETYDIICSIRNDNIENREDSQYFVPYLLRPDVKPFDLSRFHKSDWLYIGYSYKEVPHIPDGIYYCLLSSCLREWNNTKVEICYQCAKFYLKEDHYYLIVKKEQSYIGLRYCYQKMADAKTDRMFKSKIRDCIREKRPHDIVLKKLSSIVAERMPKFYNATCYFHVQCPECHKLTKITSKCSLEGNKMTECEYCNEFFSSQSAKDWKIDEEEPEISVSKEVDPKEVDIRHYFSCIANLIETDWKKLAAVLDPKISTKVIQEQNRNDVFGQAIELLNKWYNKYPHVGIRRLEVALRRIGRSDIVTRINQINQELNI
ncbi:uncharacterized protein TRIADDRAFT_63591 [Trichoplax adhaerens]|uniref:Death domain-containing protein n=1 Tax=Trichoplax adhaerens TaxID=10228 RepID=B3RKA0_TRIAD|nr:predicted protein [Trichoplax adhaerens]EDV29166.1 predicted protein [Trichoplax adhaerens]|eukprot:XP_002108368.1 predicted protein [Trichoplax adhaerens]